MFLSAGSFDGLGNVEEVDDDEDVNEILPFKLQDEENDEEAFNYVVGYVGHKLGYSSSPEEKPDSWISIVGGGKLHEPTEELKDMCRKCDTKFNEFHGMSLRECMNPFMKLETTIKKDFPNIPLKVIRLFCKVKFYARLKRLNESLRVKSRQNSVRALKQRAQFVNWISKFNFLASHYSFI